MSVESFIWGVVGGILSNALYALLVRTFVKLPSSLSRRDPRKASRSIVVMLVSWPLLNAILFVVVAFLHAGIQYLIPIPISLITVAIIFFWQINQFWKVGIRGVDQTIAGGIDYSGALRLCHNELKFLGIGASKLTAENEFKKALARCNADKSVKLLLLDPEDERLVESAQRFDRPPAEYKKNVLNSLHKIAELKKDRRFNIEVHFYCSEPIFRLMFIDNSLCLLSYYELGKGEGAQLPQVHVTKAGENRPSSESLFHPLEKYFDELWKNSEAWDFQRHIT